MNRMANSAVAHYHHPDPRSLARLSISSISTTSSGASSAGSQAMSSASPTPSSTSSPPHTGTPPAETDELMDAMDIVKVEPVEEEPGLGIHAAVAPVSPEVPGKRGRGRPRKHPIPPRNVQKVTKGRSKTGCITCRKRKKKCDETKPECLNCQKNAVVCEGYPEKTFWQPGRQRGEGSISVISPSLPNLIDGVENNTDRVLLSHFTEVLSRLLTLFNDKTNPFVELLLPMAQGKPALMHALLCVSGSHMYNAKKLDEYAERQHHHFSKAIQHFRAEGDVLSRDQYTADCATATTMLFCLDTIASGDTQGNYRLHLDAARLTMYQRLDHDSSHTRLRQFLHEFFLYHDVVNSITTLDRRPANFDNFCLPSFVPGEAGALLGVSDGLFANLSKITQLRDQIRIRRESGLQPSVDHESLLTAVSIDADIRQWQPSVRFEQEPARYIASQLYRQCTWVYLYRTIQPSCANAKVETSVDEGLGFLQRLPEESGTQSIMLLPLFLLGCAAFVPRQRPEISRRFEGLYKWSGLGNIKPAHEVVKKMWQLMDAGETERSWDWERIMKDMGHDFLVT